MPGAAATAISPHTLLGPARRIVTGTIWPTSSGAPGKFTTVFPDLEVLSLDRRVLDNAEALGL